MATGDIQIFRIKQNRQLELPPLNSIWSADGYCFEIWHDQWEILIAFAKKEFPEKVKLIQLTEENKDNNQETEIHLSETQTVQVLEFLPLLEAKIRKSPIQLHDQFAEMTELEFDNEQYADMVNCVSYVIRESAKHQQPFEAWKEIKWRFD